MDGMINELDMVQITNGFWAGRTGTVVMVYENGAGYEVELSDEDLTVTVPLGDLEPLT